MIKREMRFTTFLKLLALSHKQQRSALKKFTKPGGYNFWSPAQNLGPELVSKKLLSADIKKRVETRCNGDQAKHNVRALSKFAAFLESRAFEPVGGIGSISAPFGESGLMVKLEPEVAAIENGSRFFIHLWATLQPTLTPETFSVGLLFFYSHFKVPAADISEFFILDVVKDKLFGSKDVVPNGQALLVAEQKRLSDIWHDLTNPPSSPPAGDSPDDTDRPHP